MNKVAKHAKKVGVGITGGIMLVIGIVTIPYPGPGWLIVFAGLAILSTEFEWAQRLLDRTRGKYDAWQAWLLRQKLRTRILFIALTCAVVIITIWLLNGYGLINSWLQLDMGWLQSPLLFFR